MIFSIFFFGLFLILSESKKIFLILFCIEVLSFPLLLFFSMNMKWMFIVSLLAIITGGLVLVILALQYVWSFNKNFLVSFLK